MVLLRDLELAFEPQASPGQGCAHGPPSTTLWVPKMQLSGCPMGFALVPCSVQALNSKRSFIVNSAVGLAIVHQCRKGCPQDVTLYVTPPVSHPHCSSPCPSALPLYKSNKCASESCEQVSLVQGWVLSQRQLLLPILTGLKQQAQWQTRHYAKISSITAIIMYC